MAARLPQEDVVCNILGQRSAASSLRRGAYTLDYEIGQGGFGVIYLATLRSSGQKVACKTISKRSLLRLPDVEAIQVVCALRLYCQNL